MGTRNIILILLAISVVVGMIVTIGNPEQAGRLAQMRRDVAFTGETRETVLLLLALGLGGFIGYLALTRR
ncbi:MAG: hypothetical protein IBJ05_03850 [Blastomonas sp.]|nr:hypothetical protein [Blastomonas sp.]